MNVGRVSRDVSVSHLVAWLLFCLGLPASLVRAQSVYPPAIEWQRGYGGNTDDGFLALEGTPNGFIAAGSLGTNSFWGGRFDANGSLLTEFIARATNGGSAFKAHATSDGGAFVGGYSSAGAGGDKTTPNYGSTDMWLVRFDASGRVLWDRDFGTSLGDYFNALAVTPDGGCVVVGECYSGVNGNKISPGYGSADYWVVRVDSQGNTVWDRTYGGSGADVPKAVMAARDGGFLVAGFSTSGLSGNKTVPGYGRNDFWIIKLDASGSNVWQQTCGGTSNDVLWAAQETHDGGIICVGRSSSMPGGNKTSEAFGEGDYWAVRLDANGTKLWDASFGGTNYEECEAVCETADGGFLLGGSSAAVPGLGGNKTSPSYGEGDYWLVRLNANGQKLWEISLGGTNYDQCYGLHQAPDGGWFVGGLTLSGANGNKTAANSGGYDGWVVKLGPDELTWPPRLRWETPTSFGQPYRLLLHGTSNITYRTDVSSNCLTWSPHRTNRVSDQAIEVFQGKLTEFPQQFFRSTILP